MILLLLSPLLPSLIGGLWILAAKCLDKCLEQTSPTPLSPLYSKRSNFFFFFCWCAPSPAWQSQTTFLKETQAPELWNFQHLSSIVEGRAMAVCQIGWFQSSSSAASWDNSIASTERAINDIHRIPDWGTASRQAGDLKLKQNRYLHQTGFCLLIVCKFRVPSYFFFHAHTHTTMSNRRICTGS